MTTRKKHHVFLNPDGTWRAGWLAVVVETATDVVYANQCAGVVNDLRRVEGFLVPLGGQKLNPDAGLLDPAELTKVFHDGKACMWGAERGRLPANRLADLARLVAEVPFWTCREDDTDERGHLELDTTRLAELAEAWVPVLVPGGGRGVLMWENCD